MSGYTIAQIMVASQLQIRAADDFETGEYARAIADYTKAIKLNPDDDHAYQSRVTVYGIKGDEARAVAELDTVDRN